MFLLVSLVVVSHIAAQNQGQLPNEGVIHGTVTAQDGTPAKRVTLTALPLGVALGMALELATTDDTGVYRFEHLTPGRYTVYAEDKKAGYSLFGTGGPGPNPPEVKLTAEHPEAELDVHLPAPAGFLLIDLTNRRNGASIAGVEVTVMSKENPSNIILSSGGSSTEPVLVPADRDLLLHVTSWGFLEWAGSVGAGRPLHILSGNHFTLDVQLDPANPLTQRIPSADPKKYQSIMDVQDWQNPYLIVRADGIEVVGVSDGKGSPTIDAALAVLEGLPESAWPYGRVVAIRRNDTTGLDSERSRIETSQNLLFTRLGDLGVIVDFWPST